MPESVQSTDNRSDKPWDGHPLGGLLTYPVPLRVAPQRRVTLPGEVSAVMRRTFNALKNGRLGPVMVETPVDVVKHSLDDVPDYHSPAPVRSAGDPDDIDRAAKLLVEAERPMVLAGHPIA